MSATTAYLKPLSMADCILSLNKPSLPSIQIPSKSVKICLSHSLSTVSVSSHSPIFSSYKILSYSKKPLGILVARTSDWAQQDAQSEVDEVGFDWDKSIVEEPEARTSEWEDQSDNENDANDESDEPFVEPPEDAKLFVGNIPYDMDSENLAKLFDQAGIVEVAEVIYNRETDQSRGFGFVTMSTVEEAEKAIEMFHRYDANGRLLTVNKAAPKGSRSERPREFRSSFRIYVGNLPWQVDNSRLEQVFSEHGEVVTARVVYDRESGRSRGFGFVTMSSQNDLDAAIAALDGQTLDGRQIRVNVAEDRPPTRGNF